MPRGSVTVTAGGATLIENVDYTVDYTMGTVTILNTSIIESGTNVDVKLENQSTFSMQRKSLFGAHLEYEFSKDLVLGGTIMHLRERPLTTKVNTGSEPLANRMAKVKGLGPKTAQRIIVDLKDKVIKLDLGGDPTELFANEGMNDLMNEGVRAEAISALTMLGFAAAASGKAVDKILKAEPTLSVEAVIRKALTML